MDVYEGIEAFPTPSQGAALTIGNFDGVHRGHQHMLDTARRGAQSLSAPLVVMTFEPHPIAILHPDAAPERLTTLEERLALFDRSGVDAVIVVRSAAQFFQMRAREFLKMLCDRCRPRLIVEGPTFFFGHDREGDVHTLRALAPEFGFDVEVVRRIRLEETAGKPEVNSSAIRRALHEGRVESAAAMLGRPHRVVGVVGHGENRGAKLGFPTVNLESMPQMTPGEAVYAAVAQLEDGRLMLAGVNVGEQPTFDGHEKRVEAHLLGFEGTLRGRRVGLHFLTHLRGQRKFDSPGDLAEQVRHDFSRVAALDAELGRLQATPPIPL